jgi:hypothetical protein
MIENLFYKTPVYDAQLILALSKDVLKYLLPELNSLPSILREIQWLFYRYQPI